MSNNKASLSQNALWLYDADAGVLWFLVVSFVLHMMILNTFKNVAPRSLRISRLAAAAAVAIRSSSISSGSVARKLCILGGGNMAEAIVSSLYSTKNQPMESITVVDLDQVKLTGLEKSFGVKTSLSAKESVKDADMVLLAIKPQNIEVVAEELCTIDFEEQGTVLLSIVAGCSVDLLRESFPSCRRIIRTMPNTPSAVLEGITLWYPDHRQDELIPKSDLDRAQRLLRSFGEEIQINDESFIDMGTAISGSGPAYVFLMAECLIDAGVHLGFPRNIAEKLALSTIRGSTSYAMKSPESLSELRYKVTSPGGTTASALYELERGRFRTVLTDAVWAAHRRARELGDRNPNVGPGRTTFSNK